MQGLRLAPGDAQQPSRRLCYVPECPARIGARVGAGEARFCEHASQTDGRRAPRVARREGVMGDNDPKFGPVATTAFWAAALLTSWALIVLTVRTVARLATLVGLL